MARNGNRQSSRYSHALVFCIADTSTPPPPPEQRTSCGQLYKSQRVQFACSPAVAALRQIHRPGSSLGSALSRTACCFASVIVRTENQNVTISDRFICFILTVKRALVACVLRAATKNRSSTFFEEKSAPG